MASSLESVAGHRGHVLLIEDEQDFALGVRMMLSQAGFSVGWAASQGMMIGESQGGDECAHLHLLHLGEQVGAQRM